MNIDLTKLGTHKADFDAFDFEHYSHYNFHMLPRRMLDHILDNGDFYEYLKQDTDWRYDIPDFLLILLHFGYINDFKYTFSRLMEDVYQYDTLFEHQLGSFLQLYRKNFEELTSEGCKKIGCMTSLEDLQMTKICGCDLCDCPKFKDGKLNDCDEYNTECVQCDEGECKRDGKLHTIDEFIQFRVDQYLAHKSIKRQKKEKKPS